MSAVSNELLVKLHGVLPLLSRALTHGVREGRVRPFEASQAAALLAHLTRDNERRIMIRWTFNSVAALFDSQWPSVGAQVAHVLHTVPAIFNDRERQILNDLLEDSRREALVREVREYGTRAGDVDYDCELEFPAGFPVTDYRQAGCAAA